MVKKQERFCHLVRYLLLWRTINGHERMKIQLEVQNERLCAHFLKLSGGLG